MLEDNCLELDLLLIKDDRYLCWHFQKYSDFVSRSSVSMYVSTMQLKKINFSFVRRMVS